LTSIYSFRALNLVFYSTPSASQKIQKEASEPNINMLIPILVLCLASIFLGYWLKEVIATSGVLVWNLSLDDYSTTIITTGQLNRTTLLEAEFTEASKKLLVLVASLTTIASVTYFYSNDQIKNKLGITVRSVSPTLQTSWSKNIYLFLSNRWWLEQLSYNLIGNLFMFLGNHVTFKLIDRVYLEQKQFWLPLLFKNTIPNQMMSFTFNISFILLLLMIW
jgi:NADH:ubiquinone oxidoreductase subunit 5 (subunit L)/multisubunit Na+/H+ antiporter MnhA subunit